MLKYLKSWIEGSGQCLRVRFKILNNYKNNTKKYYWKTYYCLIKSYEKDSWTLSDWQQRRTYESQKSQIFFFLNYVDNGKM